MIRTSGLLFLCVVVLFLVLGNFPRVLALGGVMGSANLSELVLYTFAFCYFFIVTPKLLSCRLFVVLVVWVMFSLFVGLFKWGIDTTAIAYNVRLIFQITAAAVTGVFLHQRYGSDLNRFIGVYLSLYGLIVALSYIILYVFPETAVLLADLSDTGIQFHGDPHVGRLVSPYLDPNLFGIIIVLPIIMALYNFYRRPTFLSGIFAAYLLGALLLTISRSGLSLFVLIIGLLMLGRILKILSARTPASFNVKRLSFFIGLSFLFLSMVALVLMAPLLVEIADRFTNVSSDESALVRLYSFEIGMDLLGKEPFLGYGYNYASAPIMAIRGLSSLDSSLQGVLVNFGLLPTLCMILFMSLWWMRVNSILKSYGRASDVYSAWHLVTIYIVTTLLWAGNFNAILLFPFWLVPVLSMLMYFEFVAQSKKRYLSKLAIDSNVIPLGANL